MIWELACCCEQGQAFVYSRYPMVVDDDVQALKLCSKINGMLQRGALFLSGNSPVFRIRVDLTDAYGAYERLMEALEYSASVITHYWSVIQAVCCIEQSPEMGFEQ